MSRAGAVEGISRRRFLAATAAAAVVSALPGERVWGQQTPRWERKNLSDPNLPPRVLESYKRAIDRMLRLPPSDPRNWYRNALVHTLDCPHGNGWFLPWHRGYLGWFEQTCRELSGDPEFALPYWDWTIEPRVPDSFFDGVLDPTNPAYIATFKDFRSKFQAPVAQLWASFSPAQLAELRKRGYTATDDLWAALETFFFPLEQARTLTRSNPWFDDATRNAVSLRTVRAALAARSFYLFGSPKAAFHSQLVGYGVLEGQPHNLVHNNVGGFMSDFLSPVDPIFFAHHGNIDRLWQVWTRKQQALGLPTLPTGSDLRPWAEEPFLFFVDSAGQPVTEDRAGDYATIGDFGYGYQPGSAEAPGAPAAAPEAAGQVFRGSMVSPAADLSQAALARVAVPAELLQAASTEAGPVLFARVTVEPPQVADGARFHVLVNVPEDAVAATIEGPHHAATLEFFGEPHHAEGPVSFLVPLPETLSDLRAADRLEPDAPLRIQVVPDSRDVRLQPLTTRVASVEVSTFAGV